VLYELAQLYTQTSQHKKSIQKLNQLEKRIGLNKSVTYDKATQHVLLKEFKQAHKEIDAMIKKTPNDHTLWILKGDIEYDRKKYASAKNFFQKATEISPESGYVYISWARYYEAMKDFQQSEEFLYKLFGARDISFSDKMRYVEMLSAYFANKNVPHKINEIYASLLQSHPMEFSVHAAYAEFLIQQDLLPEAISHLYTAALLEPSCLECWLYLLQYYSNSNDDATAHQIAKEAVEAIPTNPVILFYAGMISLVKDEKEESLSYILEMVKNTNYSDSTLTEINATAHALLVDLYLIDKKNYPKAVEACEMALTLNPANPIVLNNCAYVFALQNEQLDRAEQLSSKSLEYEPMNVSFLDTYAYILFKQQRYEIALFFIEKAIEYNKAGEENAVIFERYGDILYFLNKQETALEMWGKALELTKDTNELLEQKINTKKYVE
jgi:predicted Zn-dependent protease